MNGRRRLMLAMAVAATTGLLARPASSQTCTASGRGASSCGMGGLMISFSVAKAAHLTVSPAGTALTTPTSAHYDLGYAATTGPSLTVRSNTPWSLAISAATTTWNASDIQSEPARTNKPAADLLWSQSSGGPFTPLSTTPVTLAGGGASTSGTVIPLFYRTLYGWGLDTPGDYALGIVFTLTAP